jgi:hypothetical protein
VHRNEEGGSYAINAEKEEVRQGEAPFFTKSLLFHGLLPLYGISVFVLQFFK